MILQNRQNTELSCFEPLTITKNCGKMSLLIIIGRNQTNQGGLI